MKDLLPIIESENTDAWLSEARVHSVYVPRRRYAKRFEAVRQAAAEALTPGKCCANLVPSPQARLSPLPAANAKERRSNEDKKVDGLKTYGSVYLFMFITSTTF